MYMQLNFVNLPDPSYFVTRSNVFKYFLPISFKFSYLLYI